MLVWFLMVERQSPAKSAFYATSLMLFIIVTQRPLKAFFRGQGAEMAAEFGAGFVDLREGLIDLQQAARRRLAEAAEKDDPRAD